MDKKLVAFDMDGTLNRIELFIIPTFREVMRKFAGRESDDGLVMSLMGCVEQEIYQSVLPDYPLERMEEFFKMVYEAEFRYIDQYHGSFDGVPEMLKKLHSEGYVLAVCSNGAPEYVEYITRALDIHQYFTYLKGSENNVGKAQNLAAVLEDLKPSAAVMVGDRSHDMEAARENGIPFIGCRYGFLPEEVNGADICVETGGEIYDAVKKLIG
ncbi:MAG: HAD family hydrolase [Oscillospiraceae bacterium]|jgi:phosphoglycolate phosphatase|nr:HAD family hydrolase [Oscillospiraceae bacterium]MDY4192392.1 HAD family hydrolase [Oscillospiraceae bacterium]